MAQRRMFNKSITNSSKFLKMPMSSRLLYYDLGMNADDDGFVEHFMVLRMTGATQQDLGVLELNGLVKIFDENVLWIKDWKENNYIQKDRYQQSKYLQMYNLDTICIQDVSTGKDSIVKNSIYNNIPKKEDYESLFEVFWGAYPKKVDKKNAKEKFKRLKPTEEMVNKMVEQIERLKNSNSWKKDDGKFIPYPSTWLNGRRWEDEFETENEKRDKFLKELEEKYKEE